MQFAPISGGVGAFPINLYDLAPDTTPKQMPGLVLPVADPYWGCGEVIYAKANGTITAMALCIITNTFDSTNKRWDFNVIVAPNTANLARPVCVAMQAMVSGEYGWFVLSGLIPIAASASVAADTSFGITAAGQIGAVAAGKQILNARVMAPATTTVAKANSQADSGSVFLNVTDSDGWFPGAYLSGTGIAAATIVTSIAPGGRQVTLSVATTAAVNGTVTATYNNATIFYNVAYLNRPFAQGAIT